MRKGAWIWYFNRCEGGDVDKIIKRAKANNLDWIALKLVSGTRDWNTGSSRLRANPSIIREFQDENIKVIGWGYHYGTNPIYGTTAQREAEAVLRAFELGIDGYIYDVEQEFEDGPDPITSASTMTQFVRERTQGAFLAYSPQAIPTFHLRFPYEIFEQETDATMPMLYWGAFGKSPVDVVTWHRDTWRQAFSAPIPNDRWMPIGQGYHPTSIQEILQFESITSCAKGRSYWLWADEWPAETALWLPNTKIKQAWPTPAASTKSNHLKDIEMGARAVRLVNQLVPKLGHEFITDKQKLEQTILNEHFSGRG